MIEVASAPMIGDAFGLALLDALAGSPYMIVDERSDGYVDVESVGLYLEGPPDWSQVDQSALELLEGRVLDIGAGAGRLSLAIQERGHSPLALDTSPGAIAVCSARGVEHTFLGTINALADTEPEPFDHAALLGNNLGLLGSRDHAPRFFEALKRLLRPDGHIVGTCLDPHSTDNPAHLKYQEANRAAGRLPGQVVLRVRYRHLATNWFDYLFTSPAELDQLARQSGWSLEDATEPNPVYLATLKPLT